MKITPIISRIITLCPTFTRAAKNYVWAYDSWPHADDSMTLPLCLIDELEHDSEPNVLANSAIQQRVQERIGIYIAAKIVDGANEPLYTARAQVRDALLGWIPNVAGAEYSPMTHVSGKRLTRNEGPDGLTWWLEIFATTSQLKHTYQS